MQENFSFSKTCSLTNKSNTEIEAPSEAYTVMEIPKPDAASSPLFNSQRKICKVGPNVAPGLL